MIDEQDDDAPEGDEIEGDLDEVSGGLDEQTQLFLELRRQNIEVLKIASQVAGFGGQQPPLRPGESKRALKEIWEVFSEFYSWVDPEEAGDEDDDDEE